MTTEELLRPRRRLVSHYPHCIYSVGDIFTLRGGWWFNGKHEQGIDNEDVEKSPDVFQMVNWWEARDEADMPKYISYVSITLKEIHGNDESKTRRFVEIKSWHKDALGRWYFNKRPFSLLNSSYLPASESEYNKFMQNGK